MFHLNEHLRVSFGEHLNVKRKCEEKDILDVVFVGLLDSAIEGVLEGAPRDAINNLYKDAQEATVTCECKQNFVNILMFQLLLFMFNMSKLEFINRGSAG